MSFVRDALLCARAAERLQTLRYEPPVTWTTEAKRRFLELPDDLQEYTVFREKQRDREIKRSQREAGDLRREAADLRRSLAAAEATITNLESKLEAERVSKASDDEIAAKILQPKETEHDQTPDA